MGIGHENLGSERGQGIGPQARETLAPLSLEADRCAEARGDEEIPSGMRKLHGHHGETSMNSKAMGSESERFAPSRVPTQRFCWRLLNGKRAGALRTPAILTNGPRGG